jgi:type I restriction enzyme S subunit
MSEGRPKGWAPGELGDLCAIRTGKLDANAAETDGIYPFFTCAEEPSRINSYSFDTEAVLLAGNGVFNVKSYKGRFDAYQRTYVIEPKSVPLEFLFYLVKWRLKFIASKNRGSTIQYLRLGDIVHDSISLPPLLEQKRIVKKIEDLQSRSKRAREALESVPALIEKFRQSVLAAAFRGDLTKEWRETNKDKIEPASELLKRIRLERRKKWEEEQLKKFKASGKVPKDDGWKSKYKEPVAVDTEGLPKLPEGWCWASVEEILSVASGDMLSAKSRNIEGEIPVYGGNGITGYHDEANVFDSTIIVGRVGFYCGSVHKAIGKAWVTDNALIATFPERAIDEDYLFWLLKATDLRAQDSSTAQPVISATKIYQLHVPIANFEEQKQVAIQLTQIMQTIAEIESSLAEKFKNLTQLDQSILAKAFRGELIPQDPNDEPASVLLERIRKEREETEGSRPAKKTAKSSSRRTKATSEIV